MSYSVEVAGDVAHIREYLKRYAHHYWSHMTAEEKGIVHHVVGHALRRLDPNKSHILSASGHEDDYGFTMTVSVRRFADDLPPPVPDEADTPVQPS